MTSASTEDTYKYESLIKHAEAQRKGVCGSGFSHSNKINPANDFYSYVNRDWIRSTQLKPDQEYIVQIDDFRLAQDRVYSHIVNIAESAPKPVRTLYESLKRPISSSAAIMHVREHAQMLDECIAEDNLWKFLAYLNTNELTRYACPISWDVLPDEQNSRKFISHITYPELSLYDYRYYLRDAAQSAKKTRRTGAAKRRLHARFRRHSTTATTIKKELEYKHVVLHKFVKYVDKIFTATARTATGEPSPQSSRGADVLHIEKLLIDKLACFNGRFDTDRDNTDSEYVKFTHSDLDRHCAGLDWREFAKWLGYRSSDIPSRVICSSVGYMKCIVETLKSETHGWKTPKWRSYWIYIYARHVIQYHAEWRDIHFDFCCKFLRGQTAPMPQRIVALFGTTLAYDTYFANEYKRRHFNDDRSRASFNRATGMVARITRAAKDMVRANTWVSDTTRAEALRKIETLRVEMGTPDKMGPDIPEQTAATAFGGDGWANLMAVSKWRTREMLIRRYEGSAVFNVPAIDWAQLKFVGSQSYVVNAYYTEISNSIYIPMGYFQTEFVDVDRGIEYNLARIGYTIGHELGHSIHVFGRMFDHTGNMRNWWSRRDSAIYNRKLADVERQYERAARSDGLVFDAKMTLSEDLADITGLKLCEMVLSAHHEREKTLLPLRLLSFERFYTEFASQNRQKIYRRSIFAQLKSNPHPLDKYRTNVPLSRMQLFNKIYNIKPGDKMHWHSDDTVW